MKAALHLSGIFGPLLVILGLWTLLYDASVKKVMKSLESTPALLHIVGMLNLLFGLLIVSFVPAWHWHPELLLTLLGWWMIIRGLFSIFLPPVVLRSIHLGRPLFTVIGIIAIIWGLGLCYLAFR